ncbi:MAG: D-alanine--D-alanine ligase [Proteobacteria bacterium]|nr:D-alanine--D-alanine ligase [Pseudomonadota bacterium]
MRPEKALHPKAYGKVAVLYGGRSSERAISLQSGENILHALLDQGVDAHGVDVDEYLAKRLIDEKFDRVFIALHGKEGEDGVVQGLIQVLGLPYTGSGVAASALAMDKARAKLVMNGLKIPTPVFGVAKNPQMAQEIALKIGFPISIKPVAEGSSIGVTRVAKEADILVAFDKAARYGDVIVEKWIDGKDFFVSILGDTVLPSVEVHTTGGFYDYQAKYESEETQYLCPAPLSAEKEIEVRTLAFNAFCALGCTGWGRVDLIQDKEGKFWVLEVNTIPGMTSHSLVPMSAKAAGLSFHEVVMAILNSTITIDQFSKIVGEVAQA